MAKNMTPKQMENIRHLMIDIVTEAYFHKRINEEEKDAIIEFMINGEAAYAVTSGEDKL